MNGEEVEAVKRAAERESDAVEGREEGEGRHEKVVWMTELIVVLCVGDLVHQFAQFLHFWTPKLEKREGSECVEFGCY